MLGASIRYQFSFILYLFYKKPSGPDIGFCYQGKLYIGHVKFVKHGNHRFALADIHRFWKILSWNLLKYFNFRFTDKTSSLNSRVCRTKEKQ